MYEAQEIKQLPETLTQLRKIDISRSYIKYLPKKLPLLDTITCVQGQLKRMEPSWTNLEVLTLVELDLENDFLPNYPKLYKSELSGVWCKKKKYDRNDSKSKRVRSI